MNHNITILIVKVHTLKRVHRHVYELMSALFGVLQKRSLLVVKYFLLHVYMIILLIARNPNDRKY